MRLTKKGRYRRTIPLRSPGKSRSRGDALTLHGQLAFEDDDAEVRRFLPPFANRQLDLLVNDPLQETRAVGEAVPRRYQHLERGILHRQALGCALQRRLELRQIVLRDLA